MKRKHITVLFSALAAIVLNTPTDACTGLRLIAEDGSVVFGRTQEWGTFDLRSRVVIVPRNYELKTVLPDGKQGVVWKTKLALVGVDALEKDVLIDGMNEKGLCANLFYHEGFSKYPEYDPAKAASSVPILALAPYLLTTCESTADVRTALAKISVVGIHEEAIGGVPPLHMIVTDRGGESIVVEFTDGVTKIHDAPLGVITNGPNYDWHISNLLNYSNVDVPLPHRTLKDLKSARFGAGSRLYGLPGDLTSPSRFLRVAAFSSTARKVPDATEGMYELFRVLDNFNLTIGANAAEGGGESNQEGMRSSTIWTTAYDTKNTILHYHTMHNRRVRMVDMKKADLDAKEILRVPLDQAKTQDIEDVTPKAK